MSQVIIVSNRLPVSVKKENGKLEFFASVGGLATGLSSYANNRRNLWIGWPGIPSDELSDNDKQAIVYELAKHNCQPVFLSQKQIDDFYNGYSNSVLWPIFHSMARKTPSEGPLLRRWWRAYREVNSLFADAILNVADASSRVWVHDYQLLLVPELLNEERPDFTVGFFLHIPFPGVKTFNRLGETRQLLKGMLGADIIGFHTTGYVNDFAANIEVSGLGAVEGDQIFYGNRQIRIGNFPMGIDYTKYAGAARSKEVKAAMRKYRKRYKGKKVIVAVDRLDPSKGLVERLRAYNLFLDKNPKQRGKVVFSMVAAPSRIEVKAYKNLAGRLRATVDEINKTYGTAKWQPVDYINESVPFEEVTALFRVADVAFIAPLRDGMNLAAKEFVASTHKRGALILSETAGASQELKDALLVNPHKPETMVAALEQALTMRRRELKRRLKRMRARLEVNTVQDWAKTFVGNLQKPLPSTPKRTHALKDKLESSLVSRFVASRKRLFLLDYDGSLVPFHEDYRSSTPPKTLLDLLRELGSNPANDVVLISGRSSQDLEKWFGDLPINLIAEHGATSKKAGHSTWQIIEKPDTAWKKTIQPILEKYAGLTPGARVEVKPHSLVWHYRGASPYYAQKYAVIIKRVLRPLLRSYGLQLMQGNKILEIKNPRISKGSAARRWLKERHDFIIGFGDDLTDEELFMAMPPDSYTIKVGRGHTAARYRVASYRDVRRLLGRLVR